MLVGAFAGTALLLAAVGLYGVVSYSVGKRLREFGIRSALGAGSGRVLNQVLSEGLPLIGLGLLLGALGSLAVARALGSVRYDPGRPYVWVLVAVAAFLAATSFLAMVIPARRATKVNPMVALRAE